MSTTAQPDVVSVGSGEAASAAPPKAKARSKRPIFIGVAAVLVIAGVSYWAYERQFEDTDDAEIDADISSISPRVSGTIVAVDVIENQRVKQGDLLAEIDPKDLEVAVALAKAQVAEADAQLKVEDPSVDITETSNKASVASSFSDTSSAEAAVSQAKKQVDQITAQLAQAQANDKNLQDEKRRAEQLIAQGAISRSELDQRTSAADASAANVEALRQAVQAAGDQVREAQAHLVAMQTRLNEVKSNAPRQVETRRASVVWRQAQLDAAKAQLEQAELNLSYAKILAPVTGIVGKKTLSVGDHVAPGQELMAIAKTDDVWVTANFRETQLRKMHPGLTAVVHIDALDEDLHGTVESIGGATGSRYSVLPPENASGNYVKVVQRIPVRIRLDPGQPGMDRLRPGMSVEPQVRL
jgi:membrane fusion protein (multidrug efflux system)